jgi:hypothetical protein
MAGGIKMFALLLLCFYSFMVHDVESLGFEIDFSCAGFFGI